MSESVPPSPVPSVPEVSDLRGDLPAPVKKWGGKLLIIGLALLIFQLPLNMVRTLTEERGQKQKGVRNEIAASWGKEQTLRCDFTPETMDVSAVVTPEVRYRGIYQSVVYTAEVEIKAKFGSVSGKPVNFSLSDGARLLDVGVEVNGKAVTPKVSGDGVEFPVAVNGEYRLRLKFRGSGCLKFSAAGRRNTISLGGKWSSPGFIGDILPDTRRVGRADFSAEWSINRFGVQNSIPEVGVNLHIAAGTYQQVERTITYATFFLVVFFFTLLAGEIISKTNVLWLQYLIAAGAPALFYLMLLSLSEQIGFAAGYAVSAAIIVAMATGYVRMFLGRTAPALVMGGVFAAGYALNFVILRMEDLALLCGTVVLAVILGVLMLLTGRLNRPAAQ